MDVNHCCIRALAPAVGALVALGGGCSGEAPVVQSEGDERVAGSECFPGEQLCNGPTLWICRPDGTAYSQIPCELGCESNAAGQSRCKVDSCVPNRRRCAGPKLAEACDAGGQPQLQVCDHGCADGDCVATRCAAGKVFCSESGNEIQECSTDGLQINDVETCPYGCDKAQAECKAAACDEGAIRCSPAENDRVQKCNAARTGWDDTDVVCTEECVSGVCHVSECTPGALRCGATALETCKSDGSGYVTSEACQWGCLDNGAGQAFCALCLPGAFACQDNAVVFCEAPQKPWGVVQECNALDTCVQGTCTKVVTLEDTQSKKQANLLLVRAFVDCWQALKKAEADGGKESALCRGINTVELSIGIGKEDLIDWFCEAVGDTVSAEDLGGPDELDAAEDVMGCGGWILNPNNLTYKTPGEQVTPGLWLVECVAFEDGEILVSPCDLVNK